MLPYFDLSTGRTIDRPFLRLQTSSPYEDVKGVGAMKCRAICAVEKQLREWLMKQQFQRLKERVEQLLRK